MDIQARLGSVTSPPHFLWITLKRKPSSSSYSRSSSPLKPCCNKRGSSQEPQQNGDNGDKFSTDWDKAWANIKKQKKNNNKKGFFSQFSSPNKYVEWDPKRSDYPPSEEVDPIKKTERSNLMFWTSPTFQLSGAIIIVTFLLLYTIIYPSS